MSADAALIVVTARDEAERIAATLAALRDAFPSSPIWVADDGSSDATPALAHGAGATVVRSERSLGKGAAATRAVQSALERTRPPEDAIALLCDGDLGASAVRLQGLLEPLRRNEADLVVAAFAQRQGGGLGIALRFARWAIRRRCGLTAAAPISGQRALRVQALRAALPFAAGFGMEIGMTIDVVRSDFRVMEVELDLEHRASGRTLTGFAHRGRQLIDFVRVYLGFRRRRIQVRRIGWQ
jgi:glycosyltransferase involved in cell wall biosynthesis